MDLELQSLLSPNLTASPDPLKLEMSLFFHPCSKIKLEVGGLSPPHQTQPDEQLYPHLSIILPYPSKIIEGKFSPEKPF